MHKEKNEKNEHMIVWHMIVYEAIYMDGIGKLLEAHSFPTPYHCCHLFFHYNLECYESKFH